MFAKIPTLNDELNTSGSDLGESQHASRPANGAVDAGGGGSNDYFASKMASSALLDPDTSRDAGSTVAMTFRTDGKFYTLQELLHLEKSPLVGSPAGMPLLKEWFGEWTEPPSSRPKDHDPAGVKRHRRDVDDDATRSSAFISSPAQPSQMGKFWHSSSSYRDRVGNSEKDTASIKSMAERFDRGDRNLGQLSPGLSGLSGFASRGKDREAAPHLASNPQRIGAVLRRPTESRDPKVRKAGDESSDWRRNADPARQAPEKPDTTRDNRTRERDSSRTRGDDSTNERRRRDRSPDEDAKKWRPGETLRPDRRKDLDEKDKIDSSRVDERAASPTRSRRKQEEDERAEAARKRREERDKETPAWMDDYVPETPGTLNGLTGLANDGLDELQRWKLEKKEKEKASEVTSSFADPLEYEEPAWATEASLGNGKPPTAEASAFNFLDQLKMETMKFGGEINDAPSSDAPFSFSAATSNGRSTPAEKSQAPVESSRPKKDFSPPPMSRHAFAQPRNSAEPSHRTTNFSDHPNSLGQARSVSGNGPPAVGKPQVTQATQARNATPTIPGIPPGDDPARYLATLVNPPGTVPLKPSEGSPVPGGLPLSAGTRPSSPPTNLLARLGILDSHGRRPASPPRLKDFERPNRYSPVDSRMVGQFPPQSQGGLPTPPMGRGRDGGFVHSPEPSRLDVPSRVDPMIPNLQDPRYGNMPSSASSTSTFESGSMSATNSTSGFPPKGSRFAKFFDQPGPINRNEPLHSTGISSGGMSPIYPGYESGSQGHHSPIPGSRGIGTPPSQGPDVNDLYSMFRGEDINHHHPQQLRHALTQAELYKEQREREELAHIRARELALRQQQEREYQLLAQEHREREQRQREAQRLFAAQNGDFDSRGSFSANDLVPGLRPPIQRNNQPQERDIYSSDRMDDRLNFQGGGRMGGYDQMGGRQPMYNGPQGRMNNNAFAVNPALQGTGGVPGLDRGLGGPLRGPQTTIHPLQILEQQQRLEQQRLEAEQRRLLAQIQSSRGGAPHGMQGAPLNGLQGSRVPGNLMGPGGRQGLGPVDQFGGPIRGAAPAGNLQRGGPVHEGIPSPHYGGYSSGGEGGQMGIDRRNPGGFPAGNPNGFEGARQTMGLNGLRGPLDPSLGPGGMDMRFQPGGLEGGGLGRNPLQGGAANREELMAVLLGTRQHGA